MSLLEHIKTAKNEKFALGQFNFCTLEQLKGIVNAAKDMDVPVILGTSGGEVNFLGIEEAVALVSVLRKKIYSEIYLNLDHGKDFKIIKKAIDSGYDMIHYDGSSLPVKVNTARTKKIVNMAKEKGVVVEGEIGKVGGSSKLHNTNLTIDNDLTSTETLVKFINETKVDVCAFSVGNSHGIYQNGVNLDFDRIIEIGKRSPVGLVMHGGSGIPDDDLKKSIENGVVKINVNTELRIAWRSAITENLKKDAQEIVPYNLLNGAEEAVYKKVSEKIKIFY